MTNTKLYLCNDSYAFNGSYNQMPLVINTDSFKLENVSENANIEVCNLDNFVGGGESVEFNFLYCDSETYICFYDLSTDDAGKITITHTFTDDTPRELVEAIMINIITNQKKYDMPTEFRFRMDGRSYETVDELNLAIAKWNKSIYFDENLAFNYHNSEEEEVVFLNNAQNAEEARLEKIAQEEARVQAEKKVSEQKNAPIIDIDEDNIPF